MKKLLSIFVCIILATSIAKCNVPVSGSGTLTVVTVDEPATGSALSSTTPSSSGISGDGTFVTPSEYNKGVNQYYDELLPDSGQIKDDSWMTLPFWFYYFQWLMFL